MTVLIKLTGQLDDVFPEADGPDFWTEERIGHEVSKLGGYLRRAFNCSKVEYTHTGTVYYMLTVDSYDHACNICEVIGRLTMFNAQTEIHHG